MHNNHGERYAIIIFFIDFPDPGCYNLTKTKNLTTDMPDTLLNT